MTVCSGRVAEMADKPRIPQVLVVEGRNDTVRLKTYFDCDTIETHGTCLSPFTIGLIAKSQAVRGVIILTDPDGPGNRIREAVNRAVPGCANAYLNTAEARAGGKVGVEHADRGVLAEALGHQSAPADFKAGTLQAQDLYELGLLGRPDSAELRRKAGQALHIGNGNGRRMLQRLNCLGITKEELRKAIHG